jgi:hypothetical protein
MEVVEEVIMAKQGDILPYLRLKLNVDQPTLEECWSDGYEIARKEGDEEANPYLQGTEENLHWNQGWWAGFYGEESWYGEQELCTSANQYRREISQYSTALNEASFDPKESHEWAGKFAKIAGAIAATIVAAELFELTL